MPAEDHTIAEGPSPAPGLRFRDAPLQPGDSAPWFVARSRANPQYKFDTVAGRHVVLCFFGSATDAVAGQVLEGILRRRERFDGEHVCFLGVGTDPKDERDDRLRDFVPGARFLWDTDGSVCRMYGLLAPDPVRSGLRRVTYVLDTRLRVLAALPFEPRPEEHASRLFQILDRLPRQGAPALAEPQAPVLVVPNVFEPEWCRQLIALYEESGGRESGFMRDVDGKTVVIVDHKHKRRSDFEITDERTRRDCLARVRDRLVPEVFKAFQFRASRIERYIVSCYDAASGGYFRPHRDNTTRGTAHRRFAVTLNLNTGEYDGGLLRFPEFGPHLYCAPAGGAVVFSCSLQHEATPVTRGRRYAFLPFLYDEAAARIRRENRRFLEEPSGE